MLVVRSSWWGIQIRQKKLLKKEPETSISQMLINYGVTQESLAKIVITIKNQSGGSFWLMTLLPIFLPIIFILIFFWFISRQAKGAGMQAFSFGQSKAKLPTLMTKQSRNV